MSNDDQKKQNAKGTSEVFAISMDEFGGSIPGVTQLLNPGLERKQNVRTSKGNTAKINLKFSGTATKIQRPDSLRNESLPDETPSSEPSPEEHFLPENASLPELGVRNVLVFSGEPDRWRYESPSTQNPQILSEWQGEFYDGMKFDPALLGANPDFTEFSAKKHRFQCDAFGLEESEWLVLLRSGKDWLAVLSKKSLTPHRARLEALLQIEPAPASEEASPSAVDAVTPPAAPPKQVTQSIKIEIA